MVEDIRLQKIEDRLDRIERGEWYQQKLLDELGNGSLGELLIPDATSLFKFKWEDALLEHTYGGIAVNENAAESAIGVAGTAVQVTIFDTNQCSNGMTPDHTNDHVTVDTSGCYFIAVSATIESVVGAGSTLILWVKKNNGIANVDPIHAHRDLAGGGGDTGSVSLSGAADLVATDTVEVWIENETNTQNYVVKDITLNLILIGS